MRDDLEQVTAFNNLFITCNCIHEHFLMPIMIFNHQLHYFLFCANLHESHCTYKKVSIPSFNLESVFSTKTSGA